MAKAIKGFTINGKRYETPAFTFKTVCMLEDYGISFSDQRAIRRRSMSLICAFLALAIELDNQFVDDPMDVAAKEIEAHIVGGGTLDAISNALAQSMEASDFFKAARGRKEATPALELVEKE